MSVVATAGLIGPSRKLGVPGYSEFRGVGTVTIDPPNIAANSQGTFAVTLNGVRVGDLIVLVPPQNIEAGLVYTGCGVTADNTVTVAMQNVTAAAINGTARTWGYIWFRL